MRRRRGDRTLLLLGVLLLLPLAESRGRDLDQVQREIQRLEVDRRSAEERLNRLMGELRTSERQIGTVTADLHNLNERLERNRDRLRILRPRFEQQLRAVAREREALGLQLRSAFVMGRDHRLKILLNQEDPQLVNRMMGYYGYVSTARIERIASLREKMRELEAVEREIARGEAELVEVQKLSERERARLEQARNARSELVAQLNREIQSAEQRLRQLRQEQEHLHSLVERISSRSVEPAPARPVPTIAQSVPPPPPQRQLTPRDEIQRPARPAAPASAPFHTQRGKLQWPLSGRIAANFGSKNEAGMNWEGVLIEAPIGTPVRAVHAGEVAFAEWMRGFGLLVIIDHGGGYMSLYGYNQTLLKREGERVEAGEVIALVGDSGGRSAPGLYFAIRNKGTPVNPVLWCQRPSDGRVG